jgi:hypothetical protein
MVQILHKSIAISKEQIGLAYTSLLDHVGVLTTFEHATTSGSVEASGSTSSGPLRASLTPAKISRCKMQDE